MLTQGRRVSPGYADEEDDFGARSMVIIVAAVASVLLATVLAFAAGYIG